MQDKEKRMETMKISREKLMGAAKKSKEGLMESMK